MERKGFFDDFYRRSVPKERIFVFSSHQDVWLVEKIIINQMRSVGTFGEIDDYIRLFKFYGLT